MNDNSGHDVGPAEAGHPVNGTGQRIEMSVADTNYSTTVSCGKLYLATTGGKAVGDKDILTLGLADVTVDSNAIWLLPPNKRTKLFIPETTDCAATRALHVAHKDNAGAVLRLVQLDDTGGLDNQIV